LKRPAQWSADALRELDAAIAYIAARNPTASRRVIAELRSAGDRLGRTATGRPGRVPGTYEKTMTGRPYIIVYAIDTSPDDNERIVILRVIHTARDWPPGQWPK
jgi:plasmid stabilization system protein ParE